MEKRKKAMNIAQKEKTIKNERRPKVIVTEDRREVKRAGKKLARECGQILRGQAPESLLNWIREKCLSLCGDTLRRYAAVESVAMDASILLKDEEEKKTYWLYQARNEHFKIFTNKNFIPIEISGDVPIDPPPDNHVDRVFIQASPGHAISIETPRWLENLGKNRASEAGKEVDEKAGQ